MMMILKKNSNQKMKFLKEKFIKISNPNIHSINLNQTIQGYNNTSKLMNKLTQKINK